MSAVEIAESPSLHGNDRRKFQIRTAVIHQTVGMPLRTVVRIAGGETDLLSVEDHEAAALRYEHDFRARIVPVHPY